MATRLVVGGPVCDRAWILPKWFEHVNAACRHADILPEFVFAVPSWDEESRQEILTSSSLIGSPADIILVKEPQRRDHRVWNEGRYHHMVEVRNRVLTEVRAMAPTYFWSLDSDILPAEDSLSWLIQGLEPRPDGDFAAVGGRTWMTPTGTQFPSYAMLRGQGIGARIDQEVGCFRVDVIMACKLMNGYAFGVDYEFHYHGEDIGWSNGCAKAGLKLGWQTQSLNKHVMTHSMLEKVDPRLGW